MACGDRVMIGARPKRGAMARGLRKGFAMSDVYRMLPRLSVNRSFIEDFLASETPCFALGMIAEHDRTRGLMAFRFDEPIPRRVADAGFRFGHSLLGNAAFEVVHFAFQFYGFKTYNVLINPNNPLAQTVLAAMVESRDYFFLELSDGNATTFRSEIGEGNLAGLTTHLPRILSSTTTEAQYQKAVASFGKNPEPPGTLLHWACRDRPDYLDLATDRLELSPQ